MQKKIICIYYLWMDAQETDNRLGRRLGIRSGRERFTIYLFLISFEKNVFYHVHALPIQKF